MGSFEGLSALNPYPTRLPGPELLHSLVRTAGRGGATAIDYLDEGGRRTCHSYTELHSLSEALALRITRALNSIPPRLPGQQLIIPLMIPQSPELYISLLAILKAGGAFCPVNLDAPRERLNFIIHDANATLILATKELAARLPPPTDSLRVLLVDDGDDISGGVEAPTHSHVPTGNDLAYVMYTSGSTGTPKGVGISHLAATQSLLAHDRHIPAFNRFLQFAAPTFDVSVFEIFFPLFRGMTLVCCDRVNMLTDLAGVIRRMEVDACELTPSVAGSLLKARANAPGLQLVLTIGEMLTEPVVNELGGATEQDSILWGMYGPTEAAIHWYVKKSGSFHVHEVAETAFQYIATCIQ
jgi:ferricrocin synthase